VNWRPLCPGDVPADIAAEFLAECPNAEVLRSWVIASYELQSGEVGVDGVADLARWLVFQEEQSEFSFVYRKWPRLENVLFGTFSDKTIRLAQRHCTICDGGHPIDEQFPQLVLPIRITPLSRQAASTVDWTAIQTAVKSRVDTGRHGLTKNQPICLSLTFVLSSANRDRDLDNLTKAMQDAIARALEINDRFVHHLDVAKLVYADAEEYVYVRTSPSFLNTHRNVIAKTFNQSWAGQSRLELADFVGPVTD
jgi:Holliday junction resolvase RusA-like endonuclease